ncbi:MAG: hypothetical protein AB7S26_26095 [Sandaracinaceae bacterium]
MILASRRWTAHAPLGVALLSLALLSLALHSLAPSVARADRPMCGERPSDEEVTRRLDLIELHIRDEEPAVRRWFTSFVLLHATMASGAALLAAFAADEGFRNEMLVGTTSSTLALLSIVVVLPPLLGAGDQVRGHDDATPEGRLDRLRAAEDLLRRDAEAIDFLQSWFPITLTSLYSAAASTFNLTVLGRTTGAFTHAVGGAIIGLGRVLLRPTGSRDRWRGYRRSYPDAACDGAYTTPGPSGRLLPYGAGLAFRLDF